MTRVFKWTVLIFTWLCLMDSVAHAASLSVACAANFTPAMKKLSIQYEKETGTDVICSFGSTGMLYGQITHGAPYDLFFAADDTRPALLHDAGLASAPTLYAKGKVVLWTHNESYESIKTWQEAVASTQTRKIGIGNPKTAPYGANAETALIEAGLFQTVEPKLAFGKSVGIAFQYAYSEAAEFSFVALSQALSNDGMTGIYWPMPEAQPIRQTACALKGQKMDEAEAFLQWTHSPSAKAIIAEYGYE